jgi:preprotein translocase subunit SecD
MEMKELAKEWRLWVLAIFLLASLIGLGPAPHDSNGDNVPDTYKLTGLNGSMGIDFTGGSQLTLKVVNNTSEEMTSQVANILGERLNTLGLGGSVSTRNVAGDWRISLTTPETNGSRVERLIAQEGSFRATMPFVFQDSRNFTLSDTYNFRAENDTVEVTRYTGEGPQELGTLSEGESLAAGGSQFFYTGEEGAYRMVEVKIYGNNDVQGISRSAQDGYGLTGDQQSGYRARIPLTVSIDSAERMRNVAQNFEERGSLIMENGRSSNLTIYIDDNKITSFSVDESFQTGTTRNPSINLNGDDPEDLRERMKSVEGYLESGNLPQPVEVIGQRSISSSIGGLFMATSVLSIIGSLIAVGFIIFVRYRNPKIALPIVFTGASEIFILFGLWFSSFATVTLSAIAGIVAAVGTGVDDQIIITDESEEETVKDWKQKMKTAFFVIFTSAASTIGAMVPILSPSLSTMIVGAGGIALLAYNYFTDRTKSHYIVIGALGVAVAVIASTFPLSPLEQIKEFATTTIVGILVGIAITRPAFAKILESMEN